MSYKNTFEEWLKTKPEEIQKLAKKYPPGEYIVNENAPYAITSAGVKVTLIAYIDKNTVKVLLRAQDKTEDILNKERQLGEKHGRTREEIDAIHSADIMASIDPSYITLHRSDLDE